MHKEAAAAEANKQGTRGAEQRGKKDRHWGPAEKGLEIFGGLLNLSHPYNSANFAGLTSSLAQKLTE